MNGVPEHVFTACVGRHGAEGDLASTGGGGLSDLICSCLEGVRTLYHALCEKCRPLELIARFNERLASRTRVLFLFLVYPRSALLCVQCEPELKKFLLGTVIVTGGNMLFPGLVERLESETRAKLDILSPGTFRATLSFPRPSARARPSARPAACAVRGAQRVCCQFRQVVI